MVFRGYKYFYFRGNVLNPNLLDTIREKAEKDLSELIDRAFAEADAILKEAATTAEDLREQVRMKVQAEADRIRERKYNSNRFRLNARRYEAKSSAIESIWRETEEILRKIEASEGFKDILETLFFESLSNVPDNSVVCVSSANADTVRACIERSGRPLILEEDPDVHGGVEFHWPDGKIVLKNTLSNRLSRLKAEGNAEISSLLFSPVEDSTV